MTDRDRTWEAIRHGRHGPTSVRINGGPPRVFHDPTSPIPSDIVGPMVFVGVDLGFGRDVSVTVRGRITKSGEVVIEETIPDIGLLSSTSDYD